MIDFWFCRGDASVDWRSSAVMPVDYGMALSLQKSDTISGAYQLLSLRVYDKQDNEQIFT